MKYQLVIFDFDGTLSDSLPWFTQVLNSIADEFQFRRVEPQELETFRRCTPREAMKRLGIPLWKMPRIATRMRALMARDVARIPLFQGVDELLRSLVNQGTALAVVTSNSRENVERILGPENSALVSHFECGTSLFGKSSRFRKVLKRSGIHRSQAIYIGDELRDLEAARRAGIAFGAVSWGYGAVEVLRAEAPTEVFATLYDIAVKVA